jgi:hypothetical protein
MAALERAAGQGPEDRIEALRDEIRAGLDEAERDDRLRRQLVEHWAIRVGDGKLVASRDGPWELYDLATERTETRDRASSRSASVTWHADGHNAMMSSPRSPEGARCPRRQRATRPKVMTAGLPALNSSR